MNRGIGEPVSARFGDPTVDSILFTARRGKGGKKSRSPKEMPTAGPGD